MPWRGPHDTSSCCFLQDFPARPAPVSVLSPHPTVAHLSHPLVRLLARPTTSFFRSPARFVCPFARLPSPPASYVGPSPLSGSRDCGTLMAPRWSPGHHGQPRAPPSHLPQWHACTRCPMRMLPCPLRLRPLPSAVTLNTSSPKAVIDFSLSHGRRQGPTLSAVEKSRLHGSRCPGLLAAVIIHDVSHMRPASPPQ